MVKGHKLDPHRPLLVSVFVWDSFFLMRFKNVFFIILYVKRGISRFKAVLRPRKNIMATSFQRPLWFVSKVAVVERFDCIFNKRGLTGGALSHLRPFLNYYHAATELGDN